MVRVVALVLAALVAASCGDSPPVPTGPSVATLPPGPAASPGADRSFPYESAPEVERGAFAPEGFRPVERLTFGDGWRLTFDTKGLLGFVKDLSKEPSTNREQTLFFTRVTKVFADPLVPGESLGDPLNARDVPADLSGWIRSLGFLEATKASDTELDGTAAKRFGARIRPNAALPRHCDPPICVTWASSEGEPLIMVKGLDLLFWTAKVGADSIVAVAAAPTSASPAFFADAADVVRSVRWR